MARMKFTGVGKKIYAVAAVSFLVALMLDRVSGDLFVMCSASCACVWIGYAMVSAPVPGLLTLRKVREAYKRRELVTDGIYAVCRHPVYAFAMVAICGLAVLFRSWIMLAVPLVTYLAALILIREEDELLARRFGQAFLDYRRKVPAFFPAPRHRSLTCKGGRP